jgi:transposase
MAAPRRVIDISIETDDRTQLERIARSRTEPASWVERVRILLAYRADPSAHVVGEAVGVTHQTVLRCLHRAVRFGVMAALDDSPRPGRAPEITADARAWLTSLDCRRAKDLGYPHELWTTRPLARHVREHAVAAGHPCLARVVQGTICKILARDDVKPHKVRYYLERRDEAFETKMADVLCVYREVTVPRAAEAGESKVAVMSHDEKPGIQAIGNTAPDLPPKPGIHTAFARDHEFKRHGTLSLLVGIDLLTGKVHACVKERHRSREFVSFLKKIDAAYPTDTAIKLILDNHSAHISKETKAWLATQLEGHFSFVITPKHASWPRSASRLKLVEGFLSRMVRSMLRHVRVASKTELKARILA